MPLANTHDRYGSVTKVFHWTTALLILAIIPLGIVASDAPLNTQAEIDRVFLLFSLHKTLGVAVFFVALARIVWALTQVKPGALHPQRRAETWLAETVHWLLYGSLVLAPLSGWIHHAALDGYAAIWWPFGQGLPLVPKSESVAHTFGALHWIFGKVMIVTLLLHIAGALKHQFVDRDATLARMWFGTRAVPAPAPHRSPASAPLAAGGLFALAAVAALALPAEAPEAAALAEVSSGWEVQEGTLGLTVTQFGKAVEGGFADWTAAIAFDPAAAGPVKGEVTATIATGSLTLGSVTAQALGPEFFDAGGFPTATFTGPIAETAPGAYEVAGTLTLKGASVPVTLPFTLALDGDTARAEGTAVVGRRDFDIGARTDDATLAPDVTITVALTATRAGE